AGERVALQNGFAAQVTLEGEVTMQLIAGAQGMANIPCPLIDIHRRRGRTGETGRAEIGQRDQGEKLLYRRVRDCRPLRLGRDGGDGKCDPLPLAKAFVAEKEEGLVPDDRPAEGDAELVAFKRRLVQVAVLVIVDQVEEVPRVEIVIAHELEGLPV